MLRKGGEKMMKNYSTPTLTLLSLTKEDILNLSGEQEPMLGWGGVDGIEKESPEIFGGFMPY